MGWASARAPNKGPQDTELQALHVWHLPPNQFSLLAPHLPSIAHTITQPSPYSLSPKERRPESPLPADADITYFASQLTETEPRMREGTYHFENDHIDWPTYGVYRSQRCAENDVDCSFPPPSLERGPTSSDDSRQLPAASTPIFRYGTPNKL